MNASVARKLARLLSALPLLLLLGACGKAPLSPEPARPVLTHVVGDNAGDELLSFSGEVRSRYETPLAFRIAGKITARLVDSGAVVKAGQVLARLDPADAMLSAAAAAAQLNLPRPTCAVSGTCRRSTSSARPLSIPGRRLSRQHRRRPTWRTTSLLIRSCGPSRRVSWDWWRSKSDRSWQWGRPSCGWRARTPSKSRSPSPNHG